MFSMPDLAVILAVALIIFGPGKLPDIGASLGKGIKNFKKATEEEPPSQQLENIEKLEHKPVSAEQQQPPEKPST